MRFVSYGIVLAALPASATAQVLWQNLELGMSEQQVQSAQPNAITNPKPDSLSGGAKCRLHIPDFLLLGDQYKACFFILDNKLTQVTLSHTGSPYKGDFDGVVDALTSKYGTPLSIKSTALGYEADWLLDNGINISVVYMEEYGRLLNIVYQKRLADEAAKL